MSNLSRVALGASLAIALFAGGAQAAFNPPSRTAPKPPTSSSQPTTGGDPTICTTLCIVSTDDPIITHKPTCGPTRTGPVTLMRRVVKPCPTSAGNTALQVCGDQLSHLRRVTIGQVRRVDDEKVHLVPLCDTVNHTLTEQQTTYLARGNVQGLIPTIGRNDTLMAELENGGYKANDVIGIALEPDAAVLYVSRR